jgi:hypothetical protein
MPAHRTAPHDLNPTQFLVGAPNRGLQGGGNRAPEPWVRIVGGNGSGSGFAFGASFAEAAPEPVDDPT